MGHARREVLRLRWAAEGLVLFLVILHQLGAADDEKAPYDAAGKQHGDDTGDCHILSEKVG